MNNKPPHLRRACCLLTSLALLTSFDPLPAAEHAETGESDGFQSSATDNKYVDKAKRARHQQSNRTQLIDDAINGVDEPIKPVVSGFDKPLTADEKRANDYHFLGKNQQDEQKKLNELKALQQLMKQSSQRHNANPSGKSLDEMMKINKALDAKLAELDKRQRELDRLSRKLEVESNYADAERRRQRIQAASQVLVQSAFWLLHNRQKGHSNQPSGQSGHHHPDGSSR